MNDGSTQESPAWEFPTRAAVFGYLEERGYSSLAERLRRLFIVSQQPGFEGALASAAGAGLDSMRWGPDFLQALPLGERTLIMGVVNVTPDSFSDGGKFFDSQAAIEHGLQLVAEGADVLDVGGESTRPGASPVPVDEELRRVVPVIEALAEQVRLPISVDTSKAAVAQRALQAGAHIVNDITALKGDQRMAEVVAEHGAGLILMHMQGTPRDMQTRPHYASVVGEILAFLDERVRFAEAAGIASERVWIDPGIGFGKTLDHNVELLRSLQAFRAVGRPLVLGTSRKSFIGHILATGVGERVEGTAATAALAVAQGVDMLRVHDVLPMVRVARMSDAIVRDWRPRQAFIGLGSNLGERAAYLRQALEAIDALPGTRLERCSSIYETAPVGGVEQPAYLNMTAAVSTALDARRLLRELLAIEAAAGRVRQGERWGPRTLDLDMLLFDGQTMDDERLTLPHPRMHERAFVLVPLAEIAPGLAWGGVTVEERLERLRADGALKEQAVQRWGPAPRC